MRIARALTLILPLAGCAPAAPGAPLWLAEPGLAWCYRTIADPDCYRQPQAGAERRLIAVAPQLFFTPTGAGAVTGSE
jgi:hypothetical protein